MMSFYDDYFFDSHLPASSLVGIIAQNHLFFIKYFISVSDAPLLPSVFCSFCRPIIYLFLFLHMKKDAISIS